MGLIFRQLFHIQTILEETNAPDNVVAAKGHLKREQEVNNKTVY